VNKTASELAAEAAGVLDRYGWHKGGFGDEETGFCLFGAVARANVKMHAGCEQNSRASALIEGYGSLCARMNELAREAGFANMAVFNDDPLTSEEDVRLLLKRAGEEL
jgi:hypothetical protein